MSDFSSHDGHQLISAAVKGIGSKESEFGNHRLHLPTSSAVDHSKVTVDELASRFAVCLGTALATIFDAYMT